MVALNRYRLKHLVQSGHTGARLASQLLASTEKFLSMVLFGNNLLNVAIALVVGEIAARYLGNRQAALLVATAASYVVSPGALGPVAADLNREIDRLSASYLIALGARVVREVADLLERAKEAGKRLATLAVDTEIRFRSAADRAAFSNELAEAITKLVSKYHDESAPGGRAHRLVVVAHPLSAYAVGSGETSPKRLRREGGPLARLARGRSLALSTVHFHATG